MTVFFLTINFLYWFEADLHMYEPIFKGTRCLGSGQLAIYGNQIFDSLRRLVKTSRAFLRWQSADWTANTAVAKDLGQSSEERPCALKRGEVNELSLPGAIVSITISSWINKLYFQVTNISGLDADRPCSSRTIHFLLANTILLEVDRPHRQDNYTIQCIW